MEDEETTAATETEEEQEEREETGETPAEAHREGEFEDLRNMLEALTRRMEDLQESLAALVSNGDVTVREDEPEEEEIKEIPGIDDLDFSVD